MALRRFVNKGRRLVPRGRTRPGRPFLAGHAVDLLIDGGPFFGAVLEAIEGAERYVYLETYILRSDTVGWRIGRALATRAEAGIEVAICYDAFGSEGLSSKYLRMLDDAGVERLPFRPLSLLRRSMPWSRRNHRKLVLVDGRVGIVGGMNIADDYAPRAQGGQGWRDTAVRVQGPAVLQLDLLFRSLWRKEKGPRLRERPTGRPAPIESGYAVRFLANFARGERAMIRRAYEVAIKSAQDSVLIMNAYFFPHRALRRAIEQAARRGVRVQLILAGTSDVKPAIYAARSLYARLLRAGVEIYEWHERVLHAKTAVVDGEWTTVGSSNLDPFSAFVNLELNAGIFSRRFGAQMREQFERDLEKSRRIEMSDWRARPWTQRLLEVFFRWFTKRY